MKSKMLLAPGIRILVLVKTKWVTIKKNKKERKNTAHVDAKW